MPDLKKQPDMDPNFLPKGESEFNIEQNQTPVDGVESFNESPDKAVKEPSSKTLHAVDESFTVSKDRKAKFDDIRQQPDSALPTDESAELYRKRLYNILSGNAKDVISGAEVMGNAEDIQNLVNDAGSESPEQLQL